MLLWFCCRYLKNNIHHSSSVFLQETHSLTQDEKSGKMISKILCFFSHGSKYSCGVAVGFSRLKSLHIIDNKSNKNGWILIIDGEINDEKLLLVNLYNPNKESEQIKTFNTLKNPLEDIDLSDK